MNVFFENQDITQIKSFTGRSMASISRARMATFSWFREPVRSQCLEAAHCPRLSQASVQPDVVSCSSLIRGAAERNLTEPFVTYNDWNA